VAGAALLAWLDPVALGLFLVLAIAVWYGASARTVAVGGLVAVFVAVRAAAKPELWDLLTPIGFGYMLVRLAHYALDRDKLPRHGLVQYLSWVFFFPILIIGPIYRFGAFLRDERRQRWDVEHIARGLERVLFGIFSALVLANWLVGRVLWGWAVEHCSDEGAVTVIVECVVYGLNLYLLFSGLSSIAIGAAQMMGFRVDENFRYPFLQRNLADFWQCWHRTLSLWCRDYVFFPLVSKGANPVLAVFASMTVLALWHDLSLRYFLWGLYHAIGLAVLRLFRQRIAPRLPPLRSPWSVGTARAASTALTVGFVMMSFVFTKSDTSAELLDDLAVLASAVLGYLPLSLGAP